MRVLQRKVAAAAAIEKFGSTAATPNSNDDTNNNDDGDGDDGDDDYQFHPTFDKLRNFFPLFRIFWLLRKKFRVWLKLFFGGGGRKKSSLIKFSRILELLIKSATVAKASEKFRQWPEPEFATQSWTFMDMEVVVAQVVERWNSVWSLIP